MHYSRMRTARLLPYLPACTAPGGLLPGGGGVCCEGGVCSGDWVSGQTPTPVYRILDTRFWKYYLAPTLRAVTRMHSSRMRTGRSLPYLGGSPWTENPPSRQEVTSYRDPPLWTDACENITLPQISFAGGNKYKSFTYFHDWSKQRMRLLSCRSFTFRKPCSHMSSMFSSRALVWTEPWDCVLLSFFFKEVAH